MLVLERILAIPDQSVDYLQCGIAGKERAALAARGFVRKDGTKAKDYMIRTIQKTEKNKEKAIIKGDVKLNENSPVSGSSQRKIGGLKADLNAVEGQIKYLETATKKQISSSRNNSTKTAYKELVAKRDALNTELAKALEADKQASAKSKSANSDTKKSVMSEDDYLNAKGAQFEANAAFHRNPRGVTKTLQKAKDAQAKKNEEISKVRNELRSEYSQKVSNGEVRPPSRLETLVARANGNADNESVQAARRLLEKRGIDYKTAKFDNDGNIKPQAPSKIAPDTAKKIKGAIAGVKGGKVVKGVSPRDRVSKVTTGDADSDKRYNKLKSKQNLSPVESNLLKTYESRINADPSQWKSGDKVGYKVLQQGKATQTNKGFEVVSVNPKTKMAKVKPIRDTGLTSTGESFDSKKLSEVHIAELVREKAGKAKAIAPKPKKEQTQPKQVKQTQSVATPSPQTSPKRSNKFEASVRLDLTKAMQSYKNPKAQKRMSQEAFNAYAKKDVTFDVVRNTRKKLVGNTAKLANPVKAKGRRIESSTGIIRRKKRDISAADISRNLERKGQMKLF